MFLSALTALAVLSPAAVAAGSASAASQPATSHGAGRVVVHTPDGALRGVRDHGVDSFLGIRYAQPPTGRLRWVPPKPVTPWQGVRSAEAYGNRCPAPASGNGPESLTEDCPERRLAHDMVAWWGRFVRSGSPGTVDGTTWPRLDPSLGPRARLLSLRAGGRSTPITDARLAAQHQCDFWDSLFAPEQAARSEAASLRAMVGETSSP